MEEKKTNETTATSAVQSKAAAQTEKKPGIQKDSYKKEIPDFRMDDQRSEVAIMKDFYTLLYGFLAQRVIDSFGAEGDQVVRRALRDFGELRGGNLRDRQLHYGLELNMRNLHTYCDLPGDDEQDTNRQVFENDDFLSYVYECEMYDLWKKYDLMDAAVAYCEEIHHAMWHTYHEDTVVVQKEILTRGDCRCSFQCTMPNYKSCKAMKGYAKGKKEER